MSRLTPLSKLLITALAVGGIFFGGRALYRSGALNAILPANSQSKGGGGSSQDVVRIGVVTWGGYAGGQYFNEGFDANENSRFFKDYGFKVEFKVLDDFDASRQAFRADEIDLLWATVDAFPTEVVGLADYEPQVVFQADWSRGGDAIVARRGVSTVADLRGKRVAVAEMTPSHTFLLWMLEAGDLKPSDVQIVKVPSAIDAAASFKSGNVDAAVVWSPDDAICVRDVPGSRILQNTRQASHIIADIFFAKKKYIEANRERLTQLYEGWMKGAAEINSSPANKQKAAQVLAKGLGISDGDALASIDNVRLCTHGDNLAFFGMDPEYKGVNGEKLYTKMGETYQKLGFAEANRPAWRLVSNPVGVKAANLTGPEHAGEAQKAFSPTTNQKVDVIATKRVSINFRSGEFLLDENAKYIIDKEFADIARGFSNARIRIEGNTDNVGAPATNRALSLKRAQSVAGYLEAQYGMSRNRFIVTGNGPDKPVADNATEEGKAKNRRTDFEIVAE